jgi:hypothetical protein
MNRMVPRLAVLAAAAVGLLAACETFTGPVAGMRLSGRVTHSQTGQGIGGAHVRVSGLEPYAIGSLGSAITDATGHYSLRVSVPPGYPSVNCSVVAVSVSASGYATLEGPLSSYASCSGSGSESATANFELTPAEP